MTTARRLSLSPSGRVDRLRREVRAALGGRADAVDACLSSARRSWPCYGRAGGPVVLGEGTLLVAGAAVCGAEGPDGKLPRVAAHRSAGPTLSPADEGTAFCRVADALPEVDIVAPPRAGEGFSSTRSAGGRQGRAGRLAAVATGLTTTGKHLLAAAADATDVEAALAMAAAAAGGTAALEERPRLTFRLLPGAGAAEAGRTAARHGAPCLVPITGPAAAGSVADALAAVSDVLATEPQAPVGIWLDGRPPDRPRTAGLAVATTTQLVRSFGVPLVAASLATGAGAPGWLAAAENSAAVLVSLLAGVDGLAGAGLLCHGASADPVALALDAEIISYLRATCAGIGVDDETLAVEVIEKVGVRGNYLGERHTRRHMREVWRPRFFDRSPYEQWTREGRAGSVDLAGEFVRDTLAGALEPPDQALQTELHRIIREVTAP